MSDEGVAGDAAGEPPVPGWPAESAQRLEKARALRSLGVEVYPTRFERSHRLGEVASAYGERTLEELEALGVDVRIAGRVLTKRGHGKASFATLGDGESQLQIYVRSDEVGETAYRVFDLVDLGDFVGVSGRVMRTRKGELSVQAREIVFLGKALLPPPEKWHGLADVEVRYRQRYLDLVSNPDVRRTFLRRSAMVSAIRRFLEERGYVEVETPMMHPIAGGASARPFVTHHNALDVDLFLRIAPELYLKRLVVGGFERVYEINRNFRNEGVSSMHNPEFTMLEFYTAYFDCRDVIDITERLVADAATKVTGTDAVSYREGVVSFALPFRRVSMVGAIAEVARSRGGASTRPGSRIPRRSSPGCGRGPSRHGSRRARRTSRCSVSRCRGRSSAASRTATGSPACSRSGSSASGTRRTRGSGSRPSWSTTPSTSRPWPRPTPATRALPTASSSSSPAWRSRTASPSSTTRSSSASASSTS
jgi:hypothetical protein